MWNWNDERDLQLTSANLFLIEPMWNWNLSKVCGIASTISIFNWTNVELKHISDKFDSRSLNIFNWTNVELKLSNCRHLNRLPQFFNWTNVELKQDLIDAVATIMDDFLIEPMWNWNFFFANYPYNNADAF